MSAFSFVCGGGSSIRSPSANCAECVTLFFMFASLARQPSILVSASDASLDGQGMCGAAVQEQNVTDACRFKELWRFRVAELREFGSDMSGAW